RPPRAKAREGPRQHRAREISGNPNPQFSRRWPRTSEMKDLIIDLQQAPSVAHNELTGCCQRHPRRALIEQLTTEEHLQAFDLRADRRLGHAKGMRRLGEATQINHSNQRSQELRRDIRHSLPPYCSYRPTNRFVARAGVISVGGDRSAAPSALTDISHRIPSR